MNRQQISEDLRRLRKLEYAMSARDLGLFVQASWHVLEPEVPLMWNWHHDYICEYLTAASRGEIRRLVINICPRSTKSTLASIDFPCWQWVNKPGTRFLFGAYADTLATQQSVLRRNLLESRWFQEGFGNIFALSEDVNTKSDFTNNKTGRMKSLGVGGAVTGSGADYIIIDDPHNPRGVESDAEREATISNFDLAWSTRLNNKKTGRIIAIMQRLRENDLSGHLLAKNQGYVHVKIPTIAEEREHRIFPVSGRVKEREAGDLLHPERDGPAEIEQAKVDLGPYGFSGQHQQEPTPKSGGIFREHMFDYVDLPAKFDWTFVTADTAYKEKQENDFTVFSAWGVKQEELFLIAVFRRQMKAVDIEVPAAAFIKRFMAWGFRGCYIEPKGHGIYLNQALLKSPHNIMIPSESSIDDFFSDRKFDKVQRANNAVPHLANRTIHISNMITEKELLVAETLKFPKAVHDDFVDTLVDAIKMVYARQVGILDVS